MLVTVGLMLANLFCCPRRNRATTTSAVLAAVCESESCFKPDEVWIFFQIFCHPMLHAKAKFFIFDNGAIGVFNIYNCPIPAVAAVDKISRLYIRGPEKFSAFFVLPVKTIFIKISSSEWTFEQKWFGHEHAKIIARKAGESTVISWSFWSWFHGRQNQEHPAPQGHIQSPRTKCADCSGGTHPQSHSSKRAPKATDPGRDIPKPGQSRKESLRDRQHHLQQKRRIATPFGQRCQSEECLLRRHCDDTRDLNH